MKQRLKWLDIAKGIGILLMVIGHTSIPTALSNFIWAFHMPLFFISSGWTTNWHNSSFQEFCIKKARTLLLPFAVYSIVVLTMLTMCGMISLTSWVFNGWGGYALWFIPVLYIGLVIVKFIFGIEGSVFRYGILIVVLLIGYILSYYGIILPWTLSSISYATFLIIIGSKLKGLNKYLHIDQPNAYRVIFFIFVTIIISHFWRLDMCFNRILPVIPLTLAAIVGSLMLFMISSWIEKNSNIGTKLLTAVGNETYIIAAFSQVTIMLINQSLNLNISVKYIFLVIILVVIKCLKDAANTILKINIF